MNELSLFSGAGGGLLGTKLLGWKTLGYVEFNEYCQQVITQRIKDGVLDRAPIFGDIKTFISEGYAESYKGMVDVLSGGFPCQPFSIAGKQLEEDDPRNMWPATLQCIRTIRPKYAFLENVSGLLALAYTRRIFGDLAEAGYNARWCVLGADDCGLCHHRKRLWIFAYSNSIKRGKSQKRYSKIRLSKRMDEGELWPWGYQSPILGGNDVVANRVDRLRAIGNGQVPIVVKTVWELLTKNGKDD